jgi:4-amino-4-deoxy-L-arabinose transferase-like glycosyltransferase
MKRAAANAWLAAILGGQAIISLTFVFMRLVARDEGFYLAAAQRIADGNWPYLDFFFPQMPLLPLIFSWLSSWGIESLLLLRVIAASAGLLLTYFTYRLVQRQTADLRVSLAAAFLAGFSGLFFAWHSTFKPYAFTDLFLLLSLYFLFPLFAERRPRLGQAFAGMLCLGLAINLRSLFVALAPLYMFWLLRNVESARIRLQRLTAALAALILASLPAILLFISSPSKFWFNNLGFHLQRDVSASLSGMLTAKAVVLAKFIVLPQNILLLGLLIGSMVVRKFLSRRELQLPQFSLAIAAVLTILYLLPHPVHLQYFQQVTPYLVLAGLPALTLLTAIPRLRWLRASGVALYLLGILPFVLLFIVSPRERDQRTTWSHVREVVASVENNSSRGDTVLSEWAGFAALSARPQLSGSEHVGWEFPLPVEQEIYHDNHLLTNEDIVAALQARRPLLVISDYRLYPEWVNALNRNYRLVSQTDITSIYRRINETS